jgi:hypothetical protein
VAYKINCRLTQFPIAKYSFVSGFTTTGLYIKDIHNVYITKPRKTYKQVGFKDVTVKNHNNNWQFISHLAPDGA